MENHVAVLYRDQILIHGGGDRYGKNISNQCLLFDPERRGDLVIYEPQFQDAGFRGSPGLSNHAALVVDNIFCLIGGFNGKERTNSVFILQGDEFVLAKNVGSVPLTGRSAHLVAPLLDGRAVVIGRETGQRRWTEISEIKIRRSSGGYEAVWQRPVVYPISVSNQCFCADDRGNYIIFGGRKSSEIQYLNARTGKIKGFEISKNLKGRSSAACGYWNDFFIVFGGLVGTVESTDSILLIRGAFREGGIHAYESSLRLPALVHSSAYVQRGGTLFIVGGCYGETTRGRIAQPRTSVIQVELTLVTEAPMTELRL